MSDKSQQPSGTGQQAHAPAPSSIRGGSKPDSAAVRAGGSAAAQQEARGPAAPRMADNLVRTLARGYPIPRNTSRRSLPPHTPVVSSILELSVGLRPACLCVRIPWQVASMVAQSLDLPPQAARWRHQQRHAAAASVKPHQSVPWGRSSHEDAEDMDPEQVNQKDVRSRVAGMLEKERE